MDYSKFCSELKFNDAWESNNVVTFGGPVGAQGNDVIDFGCTQSFYMPSDDRVNSPSHYRGGRVEAIDTIEDAIQDAPSTKLGYQQGQVLKYLLRLWLKDNPVEDAKKAQWYLNRLVKELE